MKQQKAQFDELVDAIAGAVQGENEDEDDTEEEDNEPPAPAARRQEQPNTNDNSLDQVAVLQRQLNKTMKQMEEMQKIIGQREEQAEEERELRLASQRDSLLQQALTENGVLPNAMEAAMKLFRDDIAYDEDNDVFYYIENKTGVKLPITEGIKDNMPDYFKASTIKQGGSGGRGSQANALLEAAKTNLGKLHEQAKKSGQESDIAAYHAAKKKVLEIEKDRLPVSGNAEGTRIPQSTQGVNRTAQPARNRVPSEEMGE